MKEHNRVYLLVELFMIVVIIGCLVLARKFLDVELSSLVVVGAFILLMILSYRFFTSIKSSNKDGANQRSSDPWDMK